MYYVNKHHGGATALAARAILSAGLLLRWVQAQFPVPGRGPAARAGGATASRLCAAGLGVVWAA